MAQTLYPELSGQGKEKNVVGYKHIEDRLTPELIFAFVEPIGGGAEVAISALQLELQKEKFKYEINYISVSNIITKEAERNNLKINEYSESIANIKGLSDEAKRVHTLQLAGNELRKRFKNDFLAKKIMQKISEYRIENNGITMVEGSIARSEPLRVVHIIKSIKNKSEYDLLKAVYGNMFFLIAVSGSFSQQKKNYSSRRAGMTPQNVDEEFFALSAIDQDEGVDNGQQVRDVFYKADIFLNNKSRDVQEEVSRFLGLLFGQIISSPTFYEAMMFEAFASSLKSCCLSRQVGAAIANDAKELISTGWNDVPAYAGGLATDNNPIAKQTLCKEIGGCNSNDNINKLLIKIFRALESEGLLAPFSDENIEKNASKLTKKMGLSELIEFSRAIHAEMEAILSAARTAKQGLLGGTIFVTTYPCDNCVKHILAAGLHRVVYIEPYPKSRAKVFFSDCVVDENSGEEKENKLVFTQFTGISPQAYVVLFKCSSSRKNKQTGIYTPCGDAAMPITNVFLDSFTLYEAQIVKKIEEEAKSD